MNCNTQIITAVSPAFLELKVFGFQPPSANYYSRLAAKAERQNDRIGQLIRMKAIITLIDVLEICEAA